MDREEGEAVRNRPWTRLLLGDADASPRSLVVRGWATNRAVGGTGGGFVPRPAAERRRPFRSCAGAIPPVGSARHAPRRTMEANTMAPDRRKKVRVIVADDHPLYREG